MRSIDKLIATHSKKPTATLITTLILTLALQACENSPGHDATSMSAQLRDKLNKCLTAINKGGDRSACLHQETQNHASFRFSIGSIAQTGVCVTKYDHNGTQRSSTLSMTTLNNPPERCFYLHQTYDKNGNKSHSKSNFTRPHDETCVKLHQVCRAEAKRMK